MATSYWQLEVKGERGLEEIQSGVGRGGGTLLRTHFEGGSTRIYFSADDSGLDTVAKAFGAEGRPQQVELAEVTRLG